jgi:O-antigen ligase
VVFLVRLALRHAPPVRTPLDAPILAFAVWTLLSASFSTDPAASHEHAKKLLLLAVFFLATDTLAEPRGRERVLAAALAGGLALAGLVVLQYHALGYDGFNNRPRGFLGHYMSSSGLVMAAAVLAAARLLFAREAPRFAPGGGLLLAAMAGGLAALATTQAAGGAAVLATRLAVFALVALGVWIALSPRTWPAPAVLGALAAAALPLGAWALLVSRTRNAWLGAAAGVGLVVLLRAPRALFVLGAAAAAVVLARPAAVVDRLTLTDASSVDRYYMWQAGLDMIRDKPVFGQGPGMILSRYPDYRWPEAPNPQAPHLHNNVLQLAAERGLPALGFWLWWVARALLDAWRETARLRSARPRAAGAWVAVGALAVWAAVLVAGLFEYNLGDSEVLMFFLLASALPYALRRERALLASGT